MPQQRYRIQAPDGRILHITGDHQPTPDEMRAIVARLPPVATNHVPAEGPGVLGLAGQFAGGVGDVLNPMQLVQAVRHPLDTASNAVQAQMDEFRQAKAMHEQGRTSESIGHLIAGLLPLLGPAAAHAGEMIGTADPSQIARGLGQSAGLLVPFAGRGMLDPAVHAGASRLVPAAAREAVAHTLDRAANARVVDTIAPKGSSGVKLRMGNMAADLAPQLAREPGMGAFSRTGLADKVRTGLDDATAQLDAASDARSAGHAFKTQPIIDVLLEKRRRLTAEAVEGDRTTPTLNGPGGRPFGMSTQTRDVTSGKIQPALTKAGRPIGVDVVPAPNAARVAQIDQAIREIQQLGPLARFESLRRIREAYDGPARAIYSPSMTADYLASQGAKLGAADVTAALRGQLASFDPATAAANARYSFMKAVNDVLEATEEIERVRPRVGRRIMQSVGGVLAGGAAAGPWGALVGLMTGPMMDAVSKAGVTTKIATARLLASAADAIRDGRTAVAQRALQSAAKRAGVWKQMQPGIAQIGLGAQEVSPADLSRRSGGSTP